MQILCDLGYTSTAIGEMMSSLISSKGSCFVPGKYPTTREAARAIRDCGGIAVVAHAEQFDSFALVEEYAARGWIGGVEVNHPRNGADSRKRLRGIAEKYNLLVTGGSDFHGQYAKSLILWELADAGKKRPSDWRKRSFRYRVKCILVHPRMHLGTG